MRIFLNMFNIITLQSIVATIVFVYQIFNVIEFKEKLNIQIEENNVLCNEIKAVEEETIVTKEELDNKIKELEYQSRVRDRDNEANVLLLINNCRTPDFQEFRSEDAVFVYNRSPRSSFNYTDVDSLSIQSSLVDFMDNKEFKKDIISNWLALSNEARFAVDTYFETLMDEHIPPSSMIKNFISVIEGFYGDFNFQGINLHNKMNGKIKRLNELLEKTQDLSNQEKQEIFNLATRQSPKQPKILLKEMLKIVSSLTEVEVDKDFYEKAINTRNVITHTNKSANLVFKKSDYMDLSFALENIIAAYLLNKIGVSDTNIKIPSFA